MRKLLLLFTVSTLLLGEASTAQTQTTAVTNPTQELTFTN